jgi:hypothetical protein
VPPPSVGKVCAGSTERAAVHLPGRRTVHFGMADAQMKLRHSVGTCAPSSNKRARCCAALNSCARTASPQPRKSASVTAKLRAAASISILWDIVWNAGYRCLVGQLGPAERERFCQEHLEEVAALSAPDGIWLDVGVLFTTGVKP